MTVIGYQVAPSPQRPGDRLHLLIAYEIGPSAFSLRLWCRNTGSVAVLGSPRPGRYVPNMSDLDVTDGQRARMCGRCARKLDKETSSE